MSSGQEETQEPAELKKWGAQRRLKSEGEQERALGSEQTREESSKLRERTYSGRRRRRRKRRKGSQRDNPVWHHQCCRQWRRGRSHLTHQAQRTGS